MILYFSGTGNSRYAAQLIGSVIGDEIVSMNALIKKSKQEKLHSDKPFVIVCPTYAWRIPRIVETFMNENQFSGSNKVYFVLTCGADIGNSIEHVKKICNDRKMEFQGIAGVVMPDNYIVMYEVQDDEKAKKLMEKADETLYEISEYIKKGQLLPNGQGVFLDKVKSGFVNPMFYSFFVKSKGFYSTNDCIGCGKCEAVCPLNNIKIVDKRPKWGNNCTHCMACICRCPKVAIEYKNKTKNRHRYYNAGYQKNDQGCK